ncbi:YpdA family putative bacillithiol disulfide reductase [Virgibacillus natechei]|uniref:YpdA family putative bacillithiol disulfide reductase n=1 Tax=Virgibacillus sp. CBA3643 TaxID=2942278 RepID=UPI0035A2AD79
MQKEQVIIIGGGPCGMSCAIELQKYGFNPLIIEKENVVNTIYNFPTHQTFFSSSEKLEIGGVPFITEKQKPVRNQALAYYRTVADRKQLRINTYEKVTDVKQVDNHFRLSTKKNTREREQYLADHVVVATGYYDHPNYMNIPGEGSHKVMHYFKEAHSYYNKNVAIIGGKNSAVDATLELHKAGANVTVFYRGETYSESIKPWILPEFDSLIRKDIVQMHFNSEVTAIKNNYIHYTTGGQTYTLKNDFVFAMTGYKPDLHFLKDIGIVIDEQSGIPHFNENTYETNIPGIYVAGVVAAGYNNNKIFIENGRYHGEQIAKAIYNQ